MPLTPSQSVVSVSAASSTTLANRGDHVLGIVNIGTGDANLNFGAAATANSGWPLDAAANAGRGGGGIWFDGGAIMDKTITAYSTAGTNIVVLFG